MRMSNARHILEAFGVGRLSSSGILDKSPLSPLSICVKGVWLVIPAGCPEPEPYACCRLTRLLAPEVGNARRVRLCGCIKSIIGRGASESSESSDIIFDSS
jgi:hypothetical protein